jgi:hypothetical protein
MKGYTPLDEVESKINEIRLRGDDWNNVRTGVEYLNSAVSAAKEPLTKEHPDSASMSAFGWTCLAESYFEVDLDFTDAVDYAVK